MSTMFQYVQYTQWNLLKKASMYNVYIHVYRYLSSAKNFKRNWTHI